MASSDAAVATISAPKSALGSDQLLNLILTVAPAHQLKISTPKKGSVSFTNASSSTLTQRNSILRAICGMALHNALDGNPHYLLGGHAQSVKGSPEAALSLAGISSYMSIASSIRSSKGKDTTIAQQLNEVLSLNAFLVGSSPAPTLADLDVFFALSEVSALNGDAVKGLVHLKRWIMAVHDAVEEMVASAASKQGGNSNSKLPSVEIPSLDFGIAEPVQLFYYGDEEGIDDIPQAAATGAAIQKSDASKKDQGGKPAGSAPAAGGDKSGLTEEEKKAAAEKRAKKNAEKAAKKKKNKPAAAAAPAKPAGELNVTALNIKVGKIIEVWEHPESDKLWCEKIDLGEAEPRQILSGLREFYTKEEMMGKTVLALCNLKSRKLAGIPSHGMVLCASNAEHTAVEFVIPPEGAKIGERVMFGDLEGEPEPENKIAKKKMLEKLAPDLKTNDEGMVVWKDAKSKTSAGACVASKGMKNAQVS